MNEWYEIEIKLYGKSNWIKTTHYVGGIKDGFDTLEEAQDFADKIPSWGGTLYEDAEIRIVKYTREVL